MGLEGFLGLASFRRTGRSFGSISLGRTWRFGSAGAFARLVNYPHTNAIIARASAPIVGLAVVGKRSARQFGAIEFPFGILCLWLFDSSGLIGSRR